MLCIYIIQSCIARCDLCYIFIRDHVSFLLSVKCVTKMIFLVNSHYECSIITTMFQVTS